MQEVDFINGQVIKMGNDFLETDYHFPKVFSKNIKESVQRIGWQLT